MRVKIHEYSGLLYPVFYASKHIKMNEELEYNYGSSAHHWRKEGSWVFKTISKV